MSENKETKILLNGAAGHMGREVVTLLSAGKTGLKLVGAVDPAGGEGILQKLTDFTGEADVIVDFSYHGATPELLRFAAERKLPVVIATTGHTEEEKNAIREASREFPVFFAANMSVGVALLVSLAKQAAAALPEADIEIVEVHHNRKLDAPSGTALLLADAVRSVREKLFPKCGRSGHSPRQPEEIGIHSLRMGNVVGEHEVILATPTQTLRLKHEAHTRALFAEGALCAAAFLAGKAPGLYTMEDMIEDGRV